MNHSNKLMLTYFFRAVFINLYFKTKHSNETFHLEFYSLSNGFSYRNHISSKRNISVLTISGKSRNIKIIAPSPSILLSYPPSPLILWYSLNIPWGSIFKIFFRNTHPPLLIRLPPPTIKHRRVQTVLDIFSDTFLSSQLIKWK